VAGKLPRADVVRPAGVLLGRAGDEFAGGRDGARYGRGGGGRDLDDAWAPLKGASEVPVELTIPLSTPQHSRRDHNKQGTVERSPLSFNLCACERIPRECVA
jgi:hypothetical protein